MKLEKHISQDAIAVSVASRLKQHAQLVQREMYVAYLLFKHSQTPWYARAVAAFPIAYHFSPIQLIPCFIPVLGMLDDVLIMLLMMKIVRRLAPAPVLAECRQRASTVEETQHSQLRFFTVVCVSILITFWILSATVGTLLLTHQHHM